MNVVELNVVDSSKNHGGVTVIINGDECSVNSIRGYALYCCKDPEAAFADYLVKKAKFPYAGHKEVWINKAGKCICGDPGYYEREQARLAAAPRLNAGDRVSFEGNVYEIANDFNRNYKLVRI